MAYNDKILLHDYVFYWDDAITEMFMLPWYIFFSNRQLPNYIHGIAKLLPMGRNLVNSRRSHYYPLWERLPYILKYVDYHDYNNMFILIYLCDHIVLYNC